MHRVGSPGWRQGLCLTVTPSAPIPLVSPLPQFSASRLSHLACPCLKLRRRRRRKPVGERRRTWEGLLEPERGEREHLLRACSAPSLSFLVHLGSPGALSLVLLSSCTWVSLGSWRLSHTDGTRGMRTQDWRAPETRLGTVFYPSTCVSERGSLQVSVSINRGLKRKLKRDVSNQDMTIGSIAGERENRWERKKPNQEPVPPHSAVTLVPWMPIITDGSNRHSSKLCPVILTIRTGYCETGTPVSLFYRWGNWGTERLMSMPNITHSKWQSWDLNLDLPFRISGPQTCNFSITWETITNSGLRALPWPTESETVGMVSGFLCFNRAFWVF